MSATWASPDDGRLRLCDRRARVLVVATNCDVRESLRERLDAAHLLCVGGIGTDRGVGTQSRMLSPDVVLVASSSGRAALRLIGELAEALPDASVIAVGLPEEPVDFLAVVHAGAVGYLEADVTPSALARAVRSVAAGGTALPRQLTRLLVQAYRDGLHHRDVPGPCLPADLTGREWEVLQLVWQGRSTRDIGHRLLLSPATVRTHLTAIRRKLGVDSTSRLASLVHGGHGDAVHEEYDEHHRSDDGDDEVEAHEWVAPMLFATSRGTTWRHWA